MASHKHTLCKSYTIIMWHQICVSSAQYARMQSFVISSNHSLYWHSNRRDFFFHFCHLIFYFYFIFRNADKIIYHCHNRNNNHFFCINKNRKIDNCDDNDILPSILYWLNLDLGSIIWFQAIYNMIALFMILIVLATTDKIFLLDSLVRDPIMLKVLWVVNLMFQIHFDFREWFMWCYSSVS